MQLTWQSLCRPVKWKIFVDGSTQAELSIFPMESIRTAFGQDLKLKILAQFDC